MDQPRPAKSREEVEDILLRRVFQVTLGPGRNPGSTLIFLEKTSDEIQAEGGSIYLNMIVMERVLIDRLSGPSLEPPFQYLVQCYKRAQEELRKLPNMKDKTRRDEMEEVLQSAKQLAVAYSKIVLANHDTFPQPVKLQRSPLLDLFLAEASSGLDTLGGSTPSSTVPAGFLDDFFKNFEEDDMEAEIHTVYTDLKTVVRENGSPLLDFQTPLRALKKLVDIPVCAKYLVSHPNWICKSGYVDGRYLEVQSVLGPFFHISALPDHFFFMKQEHNVGHQCFSQADTRRPADLVSSFATIKTVMHQLYEGLHSVLYTLLKNTSTREKVLEYLAEVIHRNEGRGKMNVNPMKCASSGMFVNLSAVMLKLCEPFLSDPKKMSLIDPNYVLQNSRLDFRKLTALYASSEEIASWVDKNNYARTEGYRQLQQQKEEEERRLLKSQQASCSSNNILPSPVASGSKNPPSNDGKSTKYSFVTECFFMTAKVLNFGLIKAMSEFKGIVQELTRSKEALQVLETEGAPEQDIANAKLDIDRLSQQRLCYEAQIFRDPELLQQALSFYRLMLTWLVSLVGGFQNALPAECPMEFASMPEHFVEDALDLLLFASRVARALDGAVLDDFMNFLIIFMSKTLYIRNPYLRAKMVEVLNAWMPSKSNMPTMATLFEGHNLALEFLVFNLMRVYVDIEFTGAHTQFYDKFNIRHNIAELLEYLWDVPGHRNAWKRIAKIHEKDTYLKLLNFLINDSIYLLDEALNKIPELKTMEAEVSNTVEWQRRSPEERQERSRLYQQQQNIVRIDMTLANEDVAMLAYTSSEISAPFLLPEMVERIANMLNYFLSQLVGPQRKSLSLKEPEKYEFRPKILLKQIVQVYVHLSRGDKDNRFAEAISNDGRSYKDEYFAAAADVLRRIGEDENFIKEFLALGSKARAAFSQALNAEDLLGDIPDEFLDPIQYTLMKDPVILPSSRTTVDRATITRHLLSDSTDPFSRAFLTPEMLIPDVELKAKIDEFIKSKSSRS